MKRKYVQTEDKTPTLLLRINTLGKSLQRYWCIYKKKKKLSAFFDNLVINVGRRDGIFPSNPIQNSGLTYTIRIIL